MKLQYTSFSNRIGPGKFIVIPPTAAGVFTLNYKAPPDPPSLK